MITVYPTNEIEIRTENEDGSVHFDVIVPGQFDRAAELDISDKANEIWSAQVIADYESYIESLKPADDE